MTTIQAQIIIRESLIRKQLVSKSHNNLDDYFRIISSLSGKLLASISNTKQLTFYDLESPSLLSSLLINNSTYQENVTHIAFNQNQTLIAITTRTPSIKLYQIIKTQQKITNTTTTKSLTRVKQIKPLSQSTIYGWIVSTIDNTHFIYTQNNQIYALNSITYQQQLLSIDPVIKTKCEPYYLIIDREMQHLVSSSRTGQICKFNITLKDSTLLQSKSNQFWPQISLLQSTTLSSNTSLTISDMNQSHGFILISTSKVTQPSQSYYVTFVISKSNVNIYSKIRLQQQLMAPPLTIMSDNVQNYLLAFLKGEKSLYVYDLGELQRQNRLVDFELIQSDDSQYSDVKTLSYISKQEMPFLIHGINYNQVSGDLMLGMSNYKNEDKIIYAQFGFNCSDLTLKYKEINNSSLVISTKQQSNNDVNISSTSDSIKQLCMQECKAAIPDSVFSFPRRECVIKSAGELSDQKNCVQLGVSYKWEILRQSCSLQCVSIAHSLSPLPYNQPSQCYCQNSYQWDSKSSLCFTNVTETNNDKNTTIESNTINNQTNNNSDITPPTQSSSSSVGIAVGVSLGVTVFIILILIAIYFLHKTKTYCFKKQPSTFYIEENQLKETQSAKSSNSDQNKSNNNNNDKSINQQQSHQQPQRIQKEVQENQQKQQENHQKQQENQQKQQQNHYNIEIDIDNQQIIADSQRNFY